MGKFKNEMKRHVTNTKMNMRTECFERELRSGFAEVIKHCLIADANYWKRISSLDFKDQNWTDIVEHSVEVKNKVVEEDPFEKGLRKILNFGHTIGHAIESYFLHKEEKPIGPASLSMPPWLRARPRLLLPRSTSTEDVFF